MATIGTRFIAGTIYAAMFTPLAAGVGTLSGFVYAKLSNLPAGEVAKAWTIWFVTEAALVNFCSALFEKPWDKFFSSFIILNLSTAIGIHEMRKRGFLGNKMMALALGIQIIFNIILIKGLINELSKEKL